MGEFITFTADDEDVNCNMCDNCCDEEVCNTICGAKHGWYGYNRTVRFEE